MEYHSRYFEYELNHIDIMNIKKLTVFDNHIEVKKFIKNVIRNLKRQVMLICKVK